MANMAGLGHWLLLVAAAPAAAQDRPAPPPIADEPRPDTDRDIVVLAPSGDGDPANLREMVIVGSRIPRRSLQNNPNIASATSLGGLTSDSGFDAFQSAKTKRWRSCKVDGAVLSKRVACAMVPMQKALDGGDSSRAERLALDLSATPDLSPEERYVVQAFLYRIAAAESRMDGQQRYLAAMVDTGFMPLERTISANRALASIALKSNDIEEAIVRYRDVAALAPDDTQSRVNAGVLLQRIGRTDEGKVEFRSAIAIARRGGQPVPDAWIANAR